MRRAANGLKRLVAAQLSEQLADDLRHLFLDGGSVELSADSSHARVGMFQAGLRLACSAKPIQGLFPFDYHCGCSPVPGAVGAHKTRCSPKNFAARGAARRGRLRPTCCSRGVPGGIHWQAANQEAFASRR